MVCPLTQPTGFVIEELSVSVCFLVGPGELLTDASPGSEQTEGEVNAGRGHAPTPPSPSCSSQISLSLFNQKVTFSIILFNPYISSGGHLIHFTCEGIEGQRKKGLIHAIS